MNELTISTNAAGAVVFTDANNAIADGDGPDQGCSVNGNTAVCPSGQDGMQFDLGNKNDRATITDGTRSVLSWGGDGDDVITGGSRADVFNAGAGNDAISAGGGDDVVLGDEGDDTIDGGGGHDELYGGVGNDVVNGGADDDLLDGDALRCAANEGDDVLSGDGGDDTLCGGDGVANGSDNDSLNGGDGEDHVYYFGETPVVVSLDNVAGDGQSGESDNVHSDVEDVTTGAGNDTLVGSDGRNVLDGGAGADSLSGLGGNDVLVDSGADSAADKLDGGAGDDSLAGGRGPDVYVGGDGEDLVADYAGRAFPVSVTLDGVADDGAPGEGDNVGPDVEDVTGGSGADTIVGNAADNELAGGGGDDAIAGGDGNDGLSGGAGRDVIDGGAGRDDLDGGAGADSLRTRDGATDRVNCGGGTDRVQGEARDDITGNCENLDIAPPSAVAITTLQVTRAGFVVVKLACPVVERSCAGTVIVKTVRRVSGRFIRLGQVGYRLRGGESKVVRGRIAAADRKPLKRARRVRVRAVVTNVNSDTGVSTNATRIGNVITRGL